MKIKTKVYAQLVSGSLLVALMGGVMFFADKDIAADRQTIQVTAQLMRSATELRLLGFETILLHDERSADQWQRKMRSIHVELQALELSQPAVRSTLERMRKNIESADAIHAALLLKSAPTANATPANAANEAAFAARTFAALTLVTQDVIDSTEEFSRASHRELEQTLRTVSISVAVMLVAMLAQLVFMWRLTLASILRPLTTFVDATQRVGAGDHTFRLNFMQQDEIGELARCFDEMNDRVQDMNETLRQREENISITLNSIGDAVIATDAAGLITRMNPVAERLTGWPLADAIGQPLTKVFHIISAETRLPSVNSVQLVMEHGKVVGLANHTALLARDGQEYQIADSAAPIRNAADAIVGVVLVFSDVTGKYRVEEALRASEQRFRAILEAAPVPMAVNDFAENIIYHNAAFTATFGYALADIPTLADWWPKAYPDPAYRQQVAERWQAELGRSAQTRTAFAPIEITIRCKDGTERIALASAAPLEDALAGTHLVVLHDITERKLAEDKLRNQAMLLDLANDAIIVRNLKSEIMFWNRGAEQAYGWTNAEAFGNVTHDFLHTVFPVSLETVDQALLRENMWEGELTHARRSGEQIIVTSRQMLHRDELGQPIRILEINRDITARKRAEEALRAAKDHLQTTLNAIPDLLFEVDASGRVLSYHAHLSNLLAAPPEMFMDKCFADVLPPAATDVCMNALREAATKGWATGATYSLPLPQGETWFELSAAAMPIVAGVTPRFILLARDITERHQLELTRQESEMRLRLVIRGGDIGFWDWDLRGSGLIVNERWCEMLGLDSKVLALDIEFWNSRVHPDDAPKLVRLFEQVIQNPDGQGGEVEVRARHQAGHYVWILDRFSIVSRAADGTPLRAVGTHLDITERKKAELALKASNAQLQLLETSVSRLNDIVLITEAEPFSEPGPRIVFVNDAFVRRTGFSREEVIGKSPRMLQGSKTDRKELDRIRAAMERWEPVRAELLNYTKSGEEFWIELDIVPVADATGWFTHWVAVERDVTERKQIQMDLQISLQEKTALLLEVHHRVKNNLQVITSLLRLESFRSTDAPTKSVLQDMQGRVRSMALLHETIYRKGTFAAIDLGSYAGQIAGESLKSMQVNPGAVRLQLDMEKLQVGLDQATPAGMLISELISNSLKHAFPEGRNGEICISLHPLDTAGQWRLRVSDSGIGLPHDFEERRKTSLGLQLAGDMATQMGGALHISTGPQAVFTVDFKAEVPAPLKITLDGVKQ